MRQSFARDRVIHREPIEFAVSGSIGGPLQLAAFDAAGNRGEATWSGPIEAAQKHPITPDLLREQLERLGDTPFELSVMKSKLPPGIMIPKSVLNDLRRRAIADLISSRERRSERTTYPAALDQMRQAIHGANRGNAESHGPTLYVLARTMAQLDAILACLLVNDVQT